MSGNLFTDVYEVNERMYGENAKEEICKLRSQVNRDIYDCSKPDRLHYLMFKMTNRCNSNCEYCQHATSRAENENKVDISLENIFKTIHEASELGVTAISVNGGEPLTRPDILDIIREICKYKIVPVLMTNGLLLPKMWDDLGEAGVRYLIISFDSIVKEVYEKQRGCSFEKAMDGIESALEMKEKYGTEVHVSAVLTKDNQEDFIDLVKFMTKKGIKVHISPFQNYLGLKEEISISDKSKIKALESELIRMKKEGYLIASSSGFIRHLTDFFIGRKNVPDNYICKIGYTNLFIDALSNVRPCWSDAIGPVGVIGRDSLKDIWKSDKMHECRKKMLNVKCEGCWYMCTGEVTMLLDDVLD